jgi:hypothetical protein
VEVAALPDLIPEPGLPELAACLTPVLSGPPENWKRQCIKQWDLSYVERISIPADASGSPRSVILKMVAPPWAREAEVYRLLGQQPPLHAPRLLASGELGRLTWMVLADAGGPPPTNLSTDELWGVAVGGLARLHGRTVDVQTVSPALPRYTPATFVAQMQSALAALSAMGVPEATEAQAELIRAATRVAEVLAGEPVSLIHGDCYADNFVSGPDGLALVDWSFGALAPGLLDVAALVYPDRKNAGLPVTPEFILRTYADAAGLPELSLSGGRLVAAHMMNLLLHLIWMLTRLKSGYTSVGPVDRWIAYDLGEVLSGWKRLQGLM